MTVLRSRVIPPTKPEIETLKHPANKIEPATPARTWDTTRPASSGDDDGGDAGRKRKLDVSENLLGLEGGDSEGFLNLRSGKKVIKRIGETDGGNSVDGKEKENGKETMDFEEVRMLREVSKDGADVDKLDIKQNADGSCSEKRRRRFGREEKGKAKLIDEDSTVNGSEFINLDLELGTKHSEENVGSVSEPRTEQRVDKKSSVRLSESRMEQFRDIARQNASKFAYFNVEENHLSDDNERLVVADGEVGREIEDWPGPFSTAMKIVRDREKKLSGGQRIGSLDPKKKSNSSILWIPRKGQRQGPKLIIPSLKELSMKILVQNADAITSLEHVPDALRHKLSFMLCDSRQMNSHFLNLLFSGSPTEIRLRDCSWLTEQEFTKAFVSCDTKNLTVLQLDRCGRCMPDYILLSTLASSLTSLPSLTTLSICGACRISDVGFKALVTSAPALRSINLSQCSLLTSTSMDILADKLGSFIQELYINDCQSLNAMLILPALRKLKHLEVLSVAGIETVTDEFVRGFVYACGHNMKELILTDCVKLTDFSLKVIAETCPRLCTLDLSNLYKLTDFGIGYLANGCQAIQTLKLCRNAFSDEAMAAFLETAGEPLKELSLNNVRKVADNTALSLAKRSNKLVNLDLSWCRNLSDEALGLIVDSCLSLRMLKLFGCSQITNAFLDGHSNPDLQIIGLKMSPVLEHVKVPDFHEGPLHYSSVLSSL